MSENEVKEFVSKSLSQIKEALPNGFLFEGKFDFDISVITSKEKKGKIDIKLVEGNISNSTQQVHRIKFSIVDPKSKKRNNQQGLALFTKCLKDLIEMDKANASSQLTLKQKKHNKKK